MALCRDNCSVQKWPSRHDLAVAVKKRAAELVNRNHKDARSMDDMDDDPFVGSPLDRDEGTRHCFGHSCACSY
jgi:hypothetical protein